MEFPKCSYAYGQHDRLDALTDPPAEFWPVYSWEWNDTITRDGIRHRLHSMRERGIRAFYILPMPPEFRPDTMPTYMNPGYPTEAYFDLAAFAALEAGKLGMRVWMYDEAGWPSGSANGRVAASDPSFARSTLGPDGSVEILGGSYPDLLRPAVTDRFIELTHEGYAAAFGASRELPMSAAFTDEPFVSAPEGRLPWTDGFREHFREKWGYDILEHLPALFARDSESEETRRVRGDYRDLLSEMFAQNYFLRLRGWCHAHGMLSTGHVNGDHVAIGNVVYGHHHILRCLRAMDIPGVDVIWRQIFCAPESCGIEQYAPLCANGIFPRFASSAAHQTGARLSMTESFAIYGDGLTYDQMRWLWSFQAVRGLNLLCPMYTAYSLEGSMLPSTGRPCFAPELPGAGDLAGFNLWAARLSYLMSAGKPVADAALYLPLRDIWADGEPALAMAERFQDTGRALECRGCDFDIIDDDAILEAVPDAGALRIGDAAYKVIYLPCDAELPEAVRRKLDAFCAAGGTVTVSTGDYPVRPVIESDCRDLRVSRRDTAEGRLFLLTSDACEPCRADVSFPGQSERTAWEIDLMTGRRHAVGVAPYHFERPMGDAAALLFTEREPEPAPAFEYLHKMPLAGWFFRPLRRVTLSRHGFVSRPSEEPWQPMSPGDWRDVLGEDFSGDAEYRTHFAAPDGVRTEYMLDLGEVRYSCEVILNGRPLGPVIFSPFRVRLPRLEPENTLIIRVSNTAANAFVHTDFSQWYPEWMLGPYHKKELIFEKESLPSGLYGPVRLLW